MKCYLYIDNDKIGKVEFEVIDESMGAISGDLITNENSGKYKLTVQQHFQLKGISNIEDFNFRITLENGTELSPAGGIGVVIVSLCSILVFICSTENICKRPPWSYQKDE